MAGMGAASRLADEGRPAILYDANTYPGGHTATFDTGRGFLFDDGPHVSFTKHDRIRDLLAANVEGAFRDIPARINNYWHGAWIPHPVQMHLYGLPTDLVVKIIRDFVAVQTGDQQAGDRLRVVASCGVRGHVRRDISAGLRAQVPHHHDGPADHGLAGSTDVPAQP